MDKVYIARILFVSSAMTLLFGCGASNQQSKLDGIEPDVMGTVLYRYTLNDPDPAFRIATSYNVTSDDNYLHDATSPAIVQIGDSGMVSAEVDAEVFDLNPGYSHCTIVPVFRMNGAILEEYGRWNARNQPGRQTWKSRGVPLSGSGLFKLELDLLSSNIDFERGNSVCAIQVHEIRIIHRQI